ncbi:hypothetical protein [Aquabacterium sp. CECT 9606]|uniref:hypothetical protein n=1 Tax=Aquabacterium sp. CECT 9606 TaxID=2845822 RepID=UPI001E337F5D|nr:hypothetical protein [Aquabacterium sp. CECT 9606]CAH0355536.1 hypothetical protein AQB9606_04262 [Aquabacterium sp. CECT 9606]
MPKKHVIALSKDVKANAEIYATTQGADLVTNYTLEKVQDNDTIILYTHGYYDDDKDGMPFSTKCIIWETKAGKKDLDAADTAVALQNELNLKRVSNLTVVVHACFSAGTVEERQKLRPLNTFAGQLCGNLAPYFPGVRVLGYQGQMKAGFAGYGVKEAVGIRRLTRSSNDVNKGEDWHAEYAFDSKDNLVIVSNQGKNVVFNEKISPPQSPKMAASNIVAPSAAATAASSSSSATASSSSATRAANPRRGAAATATRFPAIKDGPAFHTRSKEKG